MTASYSSPVTITLADNAVTLGAGWVRDGRIPDMARFDLP
jgi:hypothetical protein